MERLKLVTFIFFAALLLFAAIGKSVLIGREGLKAAVLVEHAEADDKIECKDVQSHKVCLQEKTHSEKSAAKHSEGLQKEPASENLSFNFIYYILYKFKYIDIFELLRPSNQGV